MSANGTVHLVKVFSDLAKNYLGVLAERLEPVTGISRYYYALVVIGHSEQEKLTQQKFADLLRTDKVTTVRIVDYLSEKGLVERTVNTCDRREHLLVTTQRGREIIPKILEVFEEIEEAIFKNFDKEKKEELKRCLLQMQHNICQLPSKKIQVKIIHSNDQ